MSFHERHKALISSLYNCSKSVSPWFRERQKLLSKRGDIIISNVNKQKLKARRCTWSPYGLIYANGSNIAISNFVIIII